MQMTSMQSQGALYVEEGGKRGMTRCSGPVLLTSKMEEGTMSQGMGAASRSWTRRGSDSPPELPGVQPLMLAQLRPVLDV